MKRLLVNVVGFHAGWLACVLGAADGLVWLGPLVVVSVIALHLALHPAWRREIVAVAIVAAGGTLLDTSHVLTGLITFGVNETRPTVTFVIWLAALWVNFAATLSVSLRWLGRWPWGAAIVGGVSGPSTYYAGAKLGAIGFGANEWLVLGILGVQWAVVLPAGLWGVARIHRGIHPETVGRDES